MQINKINDKFGWVYYAGFFIILALPLLTFSPWMYPADFPKTIIFRSILSILGFLFLYQYFYKKNILSKNLNTTNLSVVFKTSKVVWALAGLLAVFLLSSLFSVDLYFSFWGSPWRGGGFVSFAFYFIFAILTFIILDKKSWQKIWDFLILIGILVSLVAICQYYSLFSKIFLPMPSRPASSVGNPILLAIYLLLLFFITISFFLNEKMRQKKIYYGVSVLIFAFTIFISGTRAVWAGIIVGALYFLLFYPTSHSEGPKKLQFKTFLNLSRIIAGLFILTLVLVVMYINLFPSQITQTQTKNRIVQTLENRLSIKNALNDERYQGWKVALQAISNKPILGFGPENFAVAFDKNYDPKIISSFWWDKAHNIILDIGVQTGILGIITYLLLFISLFWQLQKAKRDTNIRIHTNDTNNPIVCHGVQATLIGYFVANFFSFDSFSTYLIFFLLIGYSLHLTSIRENPLSSVVIQKNINPRIRLIITSVLLCSLIIFIYQYNIIPFKINAEINKAKDLVNQKNCTQSLIIIEKNIAKHSFLDSYIRMEYVELAKKCSEFYPENNLTYIKRGSELIKEAVKIQPLYTRYYLYLGSVNNALAIAEQDSQIKKELINNAYGYFNKALELAPKHQEIFIEQSKLSITANDFLIAQNYAQKCIDVNPNYANCYWQLALSQIYSKDGDNAKINIQIAKEKGYNIDSKTSLEELSDAYGSIPDYKNLALVYEKFILLIDPNVAQYHSSLAFFYKQIGEYKKAREHAIKTLKLSPESKQAVDEFLRTLPLK